MTVAPSDESGLPAAIDRLYESVGNLVDPVKELVGGQLRAAPSLYESLLGEIPASRGDYAGRASGKSRPPVWVDAVDLRNTIDTMVRLWQPKGGSTPSRLRGLASRRWRPQDCRTIREMSDQMRGWSMSIRSLLIPESVKAVSAACPACGKRWFYKQHAGESVRQPALQLIIHAGCTCQCCGIHYPPSQYLFLARLLKFDLPTGVLQ